VVIAPAFLLRSRNSADWGSAAIYSACLASLIFIIGLELTRRGINLTRAQNLLAGHQQELQEALAGLELDEKVTVITARINWLERRTDVDVRAKPIDASDDPNDYRGPTCTKHDCKEISYIMGDLRSPLLPLRLADIELRTQFAGVLGRALNLLKKASRDLTYDADTQNDLGQIAQHLANSVGKYYDEPNKEEIRRLIGDLTAMWPQQSTGS
jgi:hypothetical protein